MIPGSMSTWRFSISISRMRSMAVMSSTMPPLTGTEPPVSPLAEPLGTIGTLFLAASFTISDISSALLGRTT